MPSSFFLLPSSLHAQFYDPTIIAQTGDATTTGETIANIGGDTSVNDSGMTAFVATLSSGAATGSAVVAGDGTALPVKISFPSLATSRVYASPQINNGNKVVARDRVSGAPPFFLIRTWDANAPGTLAIIATTTDPHAPFESAILPTMANDGGIGFVGIVAGTTQAHLYLNRSGAENVQTDLGLLTGGGFRPMAADGGSVVVRVTSNDSDQIKVFSATSPSTVASSSQFLRLGRAPGIVDSATWVAFSGVSRDDGLGIFLATYTGGAWNVERIAGIGKDGDGILDVGETWYDLNTNFTMDVRETWRDFNGNRIIDPGEDTAFQSFDTENRVGIHYRPNAPFQLDVVYIATGYNGKSGVYVTRVDPRASPAVLSAPALIVEQGQTIDGLPGTVDQLALYDPVNAEGQIVVWVSTGSAQAVVRFDPRVPQSDLTAELPDNGLAFPDGFDPNKSGTVTLHITNLGGAVASGTAVVKISLSEIEGDPAEYLLLAEISNLPIDLQPNQSKIETIPITIPANVAPGRYEFIAQVDTANAIAEQDENNNKATSRSFPVALPDLIPTEVTSINFAPTGIVPGGHGDLTVTVTNGSDVDATETNIQVVFYLSRDTLLDSNDIPLRLTAQSTPSFPLPANASTVYRADDVEIPANVVTCEDYRFLAQIDYSNLVDERDETNNTIASLVFPIHALPGDPQPPVIEIKTARQEGTGADAEVVVDFRYRDPQSRKLRLELLASAKEGYSLGTVPVNTVGENLIVQAGPDWQMGSLVWSAGVDWPENHSEMMRIRLADRCSSQNDDSGTFTLDTRRKFGIREINSPFSSSKPGTQPVIFLDTVPFNVQFTVDVDWNGRPPGTIRFDTPKRTVTQPRTNRSASFNMGSEFGPGGRLKVTAITADGFESPGVDANIEVAGKTPPFNLYPEYNIVYASSSFSYEGRVPHNQELTQGIKPTIPNFIPLFGGHEFGLDSVLSLTVAIDSKGKARLSIPAGEVADAHKLEAAGLEIGGSLSGNIDWAYQPSAWNFNGGAFTASLQGEREVGPRYWILVIPPPPFAIPLYLRGSLNISLTSEIGVTGFADDEWTLAGSLQPLVGGKVIPGAGIADFLAVEVVLGLTASSTYTFGANPGFTDAYIAFRGTVRVVALLWAWESNSYETKWPDSGGRAAILVIAAPDFLNDPGHLLPRDYLSAAAAAIDSGGAAREAAPAFAEMPLAANVFPYSQPVAKRVGDRVVLLWIADDETRSDSNRTILLSRTWIDGAWSNDVAIDVDGTADFSPEMAVTTTGAVAAWEDFNQLLANNADLADMLAATEISVSAYNASTGVWSAPVRLTTNSVLDRSPAIAAANESVLLTWIRNNNNDFIGAATSPNTLMFATRNPSGQWSSPAVIATGVGPVVGTSLAFDGQAGVYLLALDTDGDLSTDADQELYRIDYHTANGWSGLVRLTDNDVPDSGSRMLYDSSGKWVVFWHQNGVIMRATAADLSDASPVITTAGDSGSADFQVATNALGQISITWAAASAAGRDLFNAVLDAAENRWSAPIQLTDDVHMERSLTTAYLDNGTLVAVYNKVPIDVEPQLIEVGGRTVGMDVPAPDWNQTSLTSLIRPIAGDLTVISVEIAPENPAPSTDAVISAMIENVGDLAARGIQVGFYDGNPASGGVRIGELRTLSTVLGGGSSTVVSTTWRVPEDTTIGHEIHVVVDPQNRYTERDENNNASAASVLTPDLVLESHSIETLSPTSYLVQALVANRGVIPVNNAIVKLRRTDANGLILAEESVSLAADAETNVSFSVDLQNNPSGEFVAFVAVDPDNFIAESSETNNTGASAAVRVQAPVPTISPPSGVYNQPQNVVIDCPVQDCTIRYTLDGSIPGESSTLYTNPFSISSFTTVTARAFTTGRDPSAPIAAQYVFGSENRPPIVDFIGVELIAGEERMVALLAEGSDIDNGPNPLTYTWSAPNPGASVTFGATNGTTTGRRVTATVPLDGPYTLLLTVSDGNRSVTSNLSVTLPLDTDLDNMPDAWEARFWGNLAHTAAEDFDGDGQTNLQEYRSGTNPTLLAPTTPTPLEPANGSLVGLSPTLRASPFTGPGQTRHAGSQWQAATNADFTSIAWDSGEAAPSTSVAVPSGALNERTRYYWRVRYKNDSGESGSEWSAWSNLTTPAWSFRTVTGFPFVDDFSGDKGWTGFFAGAWERRPAAAGGGANGYPDPASDASAGNDNHVLGFAIGGDYPVDMGLLEIVSPPIDCSGQPVVELRFRRWLGVDTNAWAHARIEVTNDGGENWRSVWQNGATAIADGAWVEYIYDLSAMAANQPTVQVKFVMGPMSLALPYGGWNIDDLEIRAGVGRLAELLLATERTAIGVGDVFDVRVYVQENSAAASGFRGGPLDIHFTAGRVGYHESFSSAVVIQEPYRGIQTSGSLQTGLIDELGGVTTLNGFGDGTMVLYAVLRFRALAMGTAEISASAGESGFALTPPVGHVDSRRIFYGDALTLQITPVVSLPIVQLFVEGPRDPVPKNTDFEIQIFAQENSPTANGFLGGPIDLFFDPAKVAYVGAFNPGGVIQAPYQSLGIVSGTLEPNRINELGGITVDSGYGNGVRVLYAKLTFRALVEGAAAFHAAAGENGLALTSPVGLVPTSQVSYGTPIDVAITATPVAVLTAFPPALSNSRAATFVVGGSTITHYRFKVDGGAYSQEIVVATPISLVNLGEGQHILAVVGRSSLGFVQPESSPTSYTWMVDITPPAAPSVAVNSPTNNRRPTWIWSPGSGGNGTFRHQLNSEAGGWTETTARAFTPAANLSPDGAYRLYVQERDPAGNWSPSRSAAVLIDTTGPTPGAVRDGPGSDIDTQVSLNGIAANWSGFSDAGAGIAAYQWAIGLAPGGIEAQNWTSVGTVTSATNGSLALTDGTTYYVSVRAVDPVGNVGAFASSDGVTVKLDVGLQFAAAGYATSENASTVAVEVVRSGGSQRAVDVRYATSDGTAAAGTHYLSAAGTLHFAAGQPSAAFSVTVIDNGVVGNDRVVNVTLTDPDTDAVLDIATLTLIDDDGAMPSQIVYPHRLHVRSAPGLHVAVDVMYTTSTKDSTLKGLFFGMHFDSRRLTFDGLTDVLQGSLIEPPQEFADVEDLDGDASTDRYIGFSWFDSVGNWPGGALPARLALADFTLTGNWTEGQRTFIRFRSDFGVTAYAFNSRPVKVEFRTGTAGIDVDGDRRADALTDGLSILRYLAGIRGENLIAQAVADECESCDAAAIVAVLDAALADGKLDIDDDGHADAATDGMLALRFLFGFRGGALTAQLNLDGCSRCTAAAIEEYLDGLDLR